MEAKCLLYVASPVSLLCVYRSKGSSPVGWVIIQIDVVGVSHSNWMCCAYEDPRCSVYAICLYSMDLYCHFQSDLNRTTLSMGIFLFSEQVFAYK